MKILLSAILIIIFCSHIFAQNLPDRKKILEFVDDNAKTYLLYANRPSYNVSTYVTEKNHLDFDVSIIADQNLFEIPVSLSYGLFNNFDVFINSAIYNQAYNYAGDKISGFGDVGLGFSYRFQNSDYFSHSFQSVIKLPVADKKTELGTGYADYHLGIAQNYSNENWGYDLGAQLSLLRRKDFPPTNSNLPPVIIKSIDSLKQSYDYKFEPEVSVSGGPYFTPSDDLIFYTGLTFSRNTKLKFNTTDLYAGVGYYFSRYSSMSLGFSTGMFNFSNWSLSATFSYSLSFTKNFKFIN